MSNRTHECVQSKSLQKRGVHWTMKNTSNLAATNVFENEFRGNQIDLNETDKKLQSEKEHDGEH